MNSFVIVGFVHWSKRDYNQFIRLNEKFGRDDIKSISQNIDGKTPEQVIAYHEVFWRQCKDLQDYDRIIAQIEKGEAKRQRKTKMRKILDAKVNYIFSQIW